MLEVETIVVPADAVVGRRLSEQEKKKCTHLLQNRNKDWTVFCSFWKDEAQ